jgi:bifunctional non-homologous end joining protein LigD
VSPRSRSWENRFLATVSSPDKLLFPADGITKAQVAAYYERVAGLMLPHLVDRPITLERFPQGIDQPGFMQKNAGKGFPAFIRRVELPKQGGTVAYPAIDDADGLMYLVNQNTITFHIPCFHSSDLGHPDRLVLDLDPAEEDSAGARFAARATGDLLEEFGVASWVMTTGSKGYHVVVPLAPTIDFEALAIFAMSIAVVLAHRHPDRLTTEFIKKERKGRVFVDWLRNGFGATGVCPYSLRPKAGAPAAKPISWDQLPDTPSDHFTLTQVEKWIGDDPWKGAAPVDLGPAVAELGRMIDEKSIELPAFDRFGR